MKIIRTILLSIVVIGSFSYAIHVYFKGPCDTPLRYTLGAFTTKFGLSQTEFLAAIAEAESIWEKSAGRELFAYSAVGDVSIDLIYDERQATAEKNKTLEAKIDQVSGSAENIKEELDITKVEYARKKIEYESASDAFDIQQKAHTTSVSYWNGRGGAPVDEYAKLSAEGAKLKTAYTALEKQRIEVNRLATRLNALVNSYNGLVKNINSTVSIINESADKEFEQGEYVSDAEGARIHIYEFTDREALVRVLAHELGHALGMEHNTNPASIMYYLNQDTNTIPSEDDMRDLRTVCRFAEGV